MVCRQAQGKKSTFPFTSFPITKTHRAKTKPGGAPWDVLFSKAVLTQNMRKTTLEAKRRVRTGWTCVLIHQKVQLQNMNPHLVKQSVLSSDACFQERKGMFLHRNNQASMHTSRAHMISVFNRVQASLMLFQKSYTNSRQIKIMEYTFLVWYVATLPWA